MSRINIVIPMAGKGSSFTAAGYAFPKPLVDVKGRTMIDLVARNLRPSGEYRFIFVCQRELYEKYDLYNVLKNASDNNFEVVQLSGQTEGAACTVLAAAPYIDDGEELIIANSDQYLDLDINDFVKEARKNADDGLIMTFKSSHPKWSYARVDGNGKVLEVAEKKVISDNATVGLYYFKNGQDYVNGAKEMIHKNIRHNGEFYVCPVYNELILDGKTVRIYPVEAGVMHGLGTPEEVHTFERAIEEGKVVL